MSFITLTFPDTAIRFCAAVVTVVVSICFVLFTSIGVSAQGPSKSLIAAAKKEGQLTYWGVNGEVAYKLFKPFLDRYGLKMEVFDGNANVVAERVITEARAGTYTPDLIEISPEWLTFVKDRKLLATDYNWPNTKKWGVEQPLLPTIVFYATQPYPVYFNTNLIAKKDWPKGPIEKALINPHYSGLSAISTSSEQMPLLFAYYWGSAKKLNWKRSFAFFRRLIEVTKPKAVRGYTGPQKLVAAGEYGIMSFALFSRAYRNAKAGAPVGVGAVVPVFASRSAMAIAKHAPHPNAARLAAYWITTTEGQERKSSISGSMPLDPKAKSASAAFAKKWGLTPDKMVTVPIGVLTNEAALEKSNKFYQKLLKVRR